MTQYLACKNCSLIFSPSSGPSCYGCGEPMMTLITPDEPPFLSEEELNEIAKRIPEERGGNNK